MLSRQVEFCLDEKLRPADCKRSFFREECGHSLFYLPPPPPILEPALTANEASLFGGIPYESSGQAPNERQQTREAPIMTFSAQDNPLRPMSFLRSVRCFAPQPQLFQPPRHECPVVTYELSATAPPRNFGLPDRPAEPPRPPEPVQQTFFRPPVVGPQAPPTVPPVAGVVPPAPQNQSAPPPTRFIGPLPENQQPVSGPTERL